MKVPGMVVFAVCLCGALFAKEIVKIGLSIPLTGNAASQGEACETALRMIKDELKNQKTLFDYKFFVEDDQLLPRQTIINYNRLKDFNKIDGMISFFGPQSKAVAPLTQRDKIPHIGINWVPQATIGEYNFSNFAAAKRMAKVWLQAYQAAGCPPIACLCVKTDGSLVGYNAVKKVLALINKDFVAEEFCVIGDRDFRTTLMRIMEKKPKMLMIFGLTPEIDIARVQQRQLYPDLIVTTIGYFTWTDEPQLFEGCWYASAMPPAEEFVKKFETYRKHKANVESGAHMYDTLRLMVNAFEQSGAKAGRKPLGAEVIAEIAATENFPGAVGPLTAGPDRVFDAPAVLMKITNGVPVPIDIKEIMPVE